MYIFLIFLKVFFLLKFKWINGCTIFKRKIIKGELKQLKQQKTFPINLQITKLQTIQHLSVSFHTSNLDLNKLAGNVDSLRLIIPILWGKPRTNPTRSPFLSKPLHSHQLCKISQVISSSRSLLTKSTY